MLPFVFVLIWSTGFVAARLVADHADPALFLTVRFVLAAALFAVLARRAAWPRGPALVKHLVAGGLMTGVYLGASWWAVAHGLAAGVMALIGALQPLLTALAAAVLFGRRIGPVTAAGLAIGLAGVALVLAPRLAAAELSLVPVLAGLASIAALTAGTMVQKSSLAGDDLFTAGAIQHLGAALVTATMLGIGVAAGGTPHWDGSAALWLALVWAVGVLSLGGTGLLIRLVRRGDATRTTALMLLVPPVAALLAFLLFGEALTPVQFAGFALALAGVGLVQGLGLRRR